MLDPSKHFKQAYYRNIQLFTEHETTRYHIFLILNNFMNGRNPVHFAMLPLYCRQARIRFKNEKETRENRQSRLGGVEI